MHTVKLINTGGTSGFYVDIDMVSKVRDVLVTTAG